MNTFVPYTDFDLCAESLDNKRLGKQVTECGQILLQLDQFPHGGWAHHPAVRMWVGYDEALFAYMRTCHEHWVRRGFKSRADMDKFPEYDNLTEYTLPPWWGGPIHKSHILVLEAKHKGLSPKGLYFWPEA